MFALAAAVVLLLVVVGVSAPFSLLALAGLLVCLHLAFNVPVPMWRRSG